MAADAVDDLACDGECRAVYGVEMTTLFTPFRYILEAGTRPLFILVEVELNWLVGDGCRFG